LPGCGEGPPSISLLDPGGGKDEYTGALGTYAGNDSGIIHMANALAIPKNGTGITKTMPRSP